jgi:pimeloyl-ACP methyl ester carboxylesterase/lysophospholipase L1-like esterase
MSSRIEGRYAVEWPGQANDGGCRVVAIGDSTLAAEDLDDPSRLWLYRALESIHLHTGRYLRLVVLPRPGARLAQVERLASHVAEERPDVVVIAVGTNDVEPSLQIVGNLRDYTSRYRQMVRRLSGPGRVVVVTGVGNLWYTPALTRSPIRWVMRPFAAALGWYIDRAIRRAVADLDDVVMIGTRVADRTMWEGREWLYGADGFHPTAAGHDVWANLARPALADAIDHVAPMVGTSGAHGADADGAALVADVDRLRRDAVEFTYVRTRHGVARVRDTRKNDRGGTRPVVIVMPDSPNVLEHHESTFRELGRDFRVVGLEMPGAGYTDLRRDHVTPRGFDFSLDAGAGWILDVMDEAGVDEAIVTASCVNGLYAARAAMLDRERIRGLVLCQTPSVPELQAWAQRTIPWVLRNRLVGDRLLRVTRRRLAASWYEQSVGTGVPPDVRADMQARLEDVARAGFRAGAEWRLAPLMRAIRAEAGDVLEGLETPTIVLWGDRDETHRKARTDPESLPGSRKQTRRVGTGHFPELEDPDTFAAAVRRMACELWPVATS